MIGRLYLIGLILILPSTVLGDFLCQPSVLETRNPYDLITADIRSSNRKCPPWDVYANKDNAPIFNVNGKDEGDRTKFLQPFVAMKKDRSYIQVCPQDKFNYDNAICLTDKLGWINIKDLLLFRAAIRNEHDMNQKAFIKVKVSAMIDEDIAGDGMDILQFRSGPGPIGNKSDGFRALSSKNDIPKLSNLFYYVYGVGFKDNNINRYMDDDYFSQADYFLLGISYMTREKDLLNNIKGWLPKEAVVPWETRQALELVPDRESIVHRFEQEQDLIKYFKIPKNKRDEFLRMAVKEKKVEMDTGDNPKLSGQTLRPIILKLSKPYPGEMDLERALVGYTGELTVQSGNTKKKLDKDTLQVLSLINEGAKYVDVFYLIDATNSMQPVIPLAAQTVDLMQKELSLKDLKVNIRAAVYRDDRDSIREYQVWDGKGRLTHWLNEITIQKNVMDDYRESLFEGIYRAVSDWSKKFSHPKSIRLLIILGDAGDNGRSNHLSSSREVAELLMKHEILPVSIHFNHRLTKSELDPKGWGAVCEKDKLYRLPLSYVKAWERSAMCDFVEDMDNIIQIMNEQITKENALIPTTESMRVSDLEKYFGRSVDYLGENLDFYIKVLNSARRGLEYKDDKAPQPTDGIRPMFQYRLEILKKKYPGLGDLLERKAEMAFLKANVPIRYGSSQLMRPVWLLSGAELRSIQEGIGVLKRNSGAGCNLRELNKQARNAILAAFGEMLSMSPTSITDEMRQKWIQKGVVSDTTSFVDIAGIELDDICADKLKWNQFIDHLDKTDINILKIKDESNTTRRYLDSMNSAYYWVYPDELFPFPK